MNPFIKFMVSSIGRVARIAVDIALMALGLLGLEGDGSIILAVIGMVPLLAGLLEFCLFAPMLVVHSVVRKFDESIAY